MTENINLEREEENLWYRKELLWVVLANSFLIWFSVSWLMSKLWHYFLLWNAIFERIEKFSFRLEVLSSNVNESEFFNCIRSYFRFLVSIESINKRTFFWLHSIIFFHFRFHLIQNVLNQLFCFSMFVSDSLW